MTFRVAGQPDGPQLNIANGNFARIMDGLGLDHDWCLGEIPLADFARRLRRFQRALDQQPQEFTRDTKIDSGPTIIHFGCDTVQLQSYIDRLSVLVVEAVALRRAAIEYV